MHHASGKPKSPGKKFRRLVLVNEDAYRDALQCMEEAEVLRMDARTVRYDKDNATGVVRRDLSDRYMARTSRPTSHLPPAHLPPDPAPSPPLHSASTTLRTGTMSASVTEPMLVGEETDVAHDEPTDLQPVIRLPAPNRKDIPAIHLKKYDALFKKLRLSKQFQVDVAGRAVIGEAPPIAGSNFHKLMRSMFVTSLEADRAVGRREFVNALRDLGVRASEISSQSAKSALAPQGGSGNVKRKGPPGRRLRILRVY